MKNLSDAYWYETNEAKDNSSAVDDYNLRKEINDNLSVNYYRLKYSYDNKEKDVGQELNKLKDCYIMTARTPTMCVAVEDTEEQHSYTQITKDNQYDANYYEGTDTVLPNSYETKFGIVERPRQNFEVTKEISNVKVTLANGQVLLEGNPINSSISSYVTYPEDGRLKIEIDNELIEGATLEIEYLIKVANLSDKNYDEFIYYMFDEHQGDVVKTSIQLIDYMDKELSYNGAPWTIKEVGTLDREGYLSEGTVKSTFVNNYNFIVSGEREDNDYYINDLEPGKIVEKAIWASKLLSTAKDMNYDNKVEFLTIRNSVGRFYKGTPGNNTFDREIDKGDPDNNKKPYRAELVIVPPTGQTRIYYAIGISCLVLLVGGIVLIKKKVLDK